MPTIEDRSSVDEVSKLRDRLEEERRAILAEYERDIQREQAIPTDEVGDLADRAEVEIDRGTLLSAAEDERERLRLIDEALRRISDGSYGICLAGGEPISLERLEAVPWTPYCAHHEEEWEADQRAASLRLQRRAHGASFARG
jgi:DnaK suppressor protein